MSKRFKKDLENPHGLAESLLCTRRVWSVLTVDLSCLMLTLGVLVNRGNRGQGGVKWSFTHYLTREGKSNRRLIRVGTSSTNYRYFPYVLGGGESEVRMCR